MKNIGGLRVLLLAMVLTGLMACDQEKSKKGVSGQFMQEIKLEAPFPVLTTHASVTVPVSVQNNGNATWPALGENAVRLSYHWLDMGGAVVVYDGERTFLEKDLPAGATIRLNTAVKAPSKPGEYTLQLTMVQENVAWFNDKGAKSLDVPVRVEKKK